VGDIKRTLYQPTEVSTGPGPLDFGPRQPGVLESVAGAALKFGGKYLDHKVKVEIEADKVLVAEREAGMATDFENMDILVKKGDVKGFEKARIGFEEAWFGADSGYRPEVSRHQKQFALKKSSLDRYGLRVNHNADVNIDADLGEKLKKNFSDIIPNMEDLISDSDSFSQINTNDYDSDLLFEHQSVVQGLDDSILNEMSVIDELEQERDIEGKLRFTPDKIAAKRAKARTLVNKHSSFKTLRDFMGSLQPDATPLEKMEHLSSYKASIQDGTAPVSYYDSETNTFKEGVSSELDEFQKSYILSAVNSTERFLTSEASLEAQEAQTQKEALKDAASIEFKEQDEQRKQQNDIKAQSRREDISLFDSTLIESVETTDADTIKVTLASGKNLKIRFPGIDASEMSQPQGEEHRDTVHKALTNGTAKVRIRGRDANNRVLADVIVDGKYITDVLFDLGIARAYRGEDFRANREASTGRPDVMKKFGAKGSYDDAPFYLSASPRDTASSLFDLIYDKMSNRLLPEYEYPAKSNPKYYDKDGYFKQESYIKDVDKERKEILDAFVTEVIYTHPDGVVKSFLDIYEGTVPLDEREALRDTYNKTINDQDKRIIRDPVAFMRDKDPEAFEIYSKEMDDIKNREVSGSITPERARRERVDSSTRHRQDIFHGAKRYLSGSAKENGVDIDGKNEKLLYFLPEQTEKYDEAIREGVPVSRAFYDHFYSAHLESSSNTQSEESPHLIEIMERTLKEKGLPEELISRYKQAFPNLDQFDNSFSVLDIDKEAILAYNTNVGVENRFDFDNFIASTSDLLYKRLLPFKNLTIQDSLSIKQNLALRVYADVLKQGNTWFNKDVSGSREKYATLAQQHLNSLFSKYSESSDGGMVSNAGLSKLSEKEQLLVKKQNYKNELEYTMKRDLWLEENIFQPHRTEDGEIIHLPVIPNSKVLEDSEFRWIESPRGVVGGLYIKGSDQPLMIRVDGNTVPLELSTTSLTERYFNTVSSNLPGARRASRARSEASWREPYSMAPDVSLLLGAPRTGYEDKVVGERTRTPANLPGGIYSYGTSSGRSFKEDVTREYFSPRNEEGRLTSPYIEELDFFRLDESDINLGVMGDPVLSGISGAAKGAGLNGDSDPVGPNGDSDPITSMSSEEAEEAGMATGTNMGDSMMAPGGISVSPDLSTSTELIKFEEGEEKVDGKHVSYKDDTFEKGVVSGGRGHRLTKAEKKKYPVGTVIPDSVVEKWFKEDVAKARRAAIRSVDRFSDLPEPVKDAVTSLAFQIGEGKTGGAKGLKGFKDTIKILEERPFTKDVAIRASKEILDSKWAKEQTPERAQRAAKMIRESV